MKKILLILLLLSLTNCASNKTKMKVNESRVIFTHPKSGKEETVDVSRLVRVFVNNIESHKRSVK